MATVSRLPDYTTLGTDPPPASADGYTCSSGAGCRQTFAGFPVSVLPADCRPVLQQTRGCQKNPVTQQFGVMCTKIDAAAGCQGAATAAQGSLGSDGWLRCWQPGSQTPPDYGCFAKDPQANRLIRGMNTAPAQGTVSLGALW